MVILKNITKTQNSISADYYPEGRSGKGFMKLRLEDEEVIEHQNASFFAAPHVRYELRRFAKEENPPREKLCYSIKETFESKIHGS